MLLEDKMAVEKISVSLDEALIARARQEAEESGLSLSSWLAKGAARLIEEADAKRAMEEYIRLFGEPEAAAAEAIRRKLEEAGAYRPETAEEEALRLRAIARLRGIDLDSEAGDSEAGGVG